MRSLSKPLVAIIWLAIALLSAAPAQGNDVIVWRTTDWAPMYIPDGDESEIGTGLYDRLISAFKKAMPDHYHLDVKMTTNRALEQMRNPKEGVAVCHVSMIKRQAIGKAHLSKLNSILLTHEVVYRTELKHKFDRLIDDDDTISIESLVENPDLVGGIASFGTHLELEKYAAKYSEMPQLVYIPEAYQTLLQMLMHGRIDYIIQYRPVVEYVEDAQNLTGSTVFVRIRETVDKPFVKVYAACSKNSVGAYAISVINETLDREQREGRLLPLQLSIYNDLADRTRLREYYLSDEGE